MEAYFTLDSWIRRYRAGKGLKVRIVFLAVPSRSDGISAEGPPP